MSKRIYKKINFLTVLRVINFEIKRKRIVFGNHFFLFSLNNDIVSKGQKIVVNASKINENIGLKKFIINHFFQFLKFFVTRNYLVNQIVILEHIKKNRTHYVIDDTNHYIILYLLHWLSPEFLIHQLYTALIFYYFNFRIILILIELWKLFWFFYDANSFQSEKN